MDLLKMIWPTAFMVKEKDVATLVIHIVIFLVVSIVVGAVLGLLMWIPIVNIIFGLVGSLVGLYCLVGIVLSVLKVTNTIA